MKVRWVALCLALICPGLGHFYMAKPLKGTVLLICSFIVTLMLLYNFQLSICVGIVIVLCVYSVYDVYKLFDKVRS